MSISPSKSLFPLKEIPDVTDTLKEAAANGKLVGFIGAGASRLAGSPDWESFANAALDQLVSFGQLKHSERDQIRHLSAKIKLFIAKNVAQNTGCKLDYQKILEPASSKRDVGERLYRNLSAIASTFVTTNYDTWLDRKYPLVEMGGSSKAAASAPPLSSMKVIWDPEQFTVDKLSEDTVIHLHGSLKAPESMVLSTRDYIDHYANDRGSSNPEKENRILTFLSQLFNKRNVLFVGYGLAELEILEYVVLKQERFKEGHLSEVRHFLLQGFYSHQSDLIAHLSEYYHQECNIQLIPFSMDHKGYDQLVEVIEAWASQIKPGKLPPLDDRLEMESLLDE